MFPRLIFFEVTADGGGAGGPAIFDEAPLDPAPEAPAAPLAPEAPEAPAAEWTPELQEQFGEVAGFVGQMRDMFERAEAEEQAQAERAQAEQAQAAREAGLPEWDPIDPQSVESYVTAAAQRALAEPLQQIAQQLQALHPFALSAAEEQGERLAEQVFDQLAGDGGIGTFDRDLALRMAVFMQGEGFSGEQALRAGALEAQRIENEIRQNAQGTLAERQARVAELGGEPAVTGPLGAEEEPQLPQGRLAYREQARASLSRLRPGPPQ